MARALDNYFLPGSEVSTTDLELPAELAGLSGAMYVMSQCDVVTREPAGAFFGGDALLHRVRIRDGKADYRRRVARPDTHDYRSMSTMFSKSSMAELLAENIIRSPWRAARAALRGDRMGLLGVKGAPNVTLFSVGSDLYCSADSLPPARMGDDMSTLPSEIPGGMARLWSAHAAPYPSSDATVLTCYDVVRRRTSAWAFERSHGRTESYLLRSAPGGNSTHDVVVGDNYVAFTPMPVTPSLTRPVLRWRTKPTELWLMRHSGASWLPECLRVPLNDYFMSHFTRCEDDGRTLRIEGIATRFKDFIDFVGDRESAPAKVFYNTFYLTLTVDLRTGRVVEHNEWLPFGEARIEFPVMDAVAYPEQVFCLVFDKDGIGLARLHPGSQRGDLYADDASFFCQPQLMKDARSGRCWLTTMRFDFDCAHGELLFFDPDLLHRGPVHRMRLPKPAGRMLHSWWFDAETGAVFDGKRRSTIPPPG